ncbi:MAG TPA: efflux RND transporter periplasmic adaptor subunit [Rubrivivax sp.]|nr:efflux RND transporter periplasmic adaptor subunit [Rubrivivax sp.]
MNQPLPAVHAAHAADAARAAALAATLAAVLSGCAPEPAPPPPIPSVFVSPVRNDHGNAERVLSGSLRPRVEAELAFRTGGKVSARLVELGQHVRAGQAVATIDAADYRLALQAALEQQRAAEVDAVQAASDAARFKRLLVDGSVSTADAERQQARADAAAARLTQAQQQAELARNRAGYAVLSAPFDGVVTAVHFERGQMVDDSRPVLSLARPGELEVVVDVPESLVNGLKAWQASMVVGASASPSAAPPVPLRLRELAPSAHAATRTTRARYALAAGAAGTELRMGMTAEVRLQQAGRVSGAELPLGALLVTAAAGTPHAASAAGASTGPSVWLVDATTGALKRRPVQLLSQTTDHVRVAGLPDGAMVVTVGAQKLDAGLKVQAVQRPLAGLSATVDAR